MFEFLDAVLVEPRAQPITDRDEKSAAEHHGNSVSNDECHKIKSNRAGGDNHRTSNAGEKFTHRNDADAVIFKHFLDAFDPFFGEMFSNERQLGDFQAEFFAEVVENNIPADDPAPADDRGNRQMHFPCYQCPGNKQWNIFRQRQTEPAGEKQTEQHEISARFEPTVNRLNAYRQQKHCATIAQQRGRGKAAEFRKCVS